MPDFLNSLALTFSECLEIVRKKNSDYATEDDPFKNFRFAELVGVSPKRAILVRMADKLARINNLLEKENQVKDESIKDTLEDIINYAAILKVWIESGDDNRRTKGVDIPSPGGKEKGQGDS